MKIISYALTLICSSFILTSCIRENATPVKIPPIEGAVVAPPVGGATQPHQVWIDLSENTSKINLRNAWDLALYNGSDFRVILNSSMMMAVGKVEGASNIDAITPQMVESLKNKVQVANFEDNAMYVDAPSGNYLSQTTGIAPIKENDSENPVYLLNMGKNLYTGSTLPGSVYTAGTDRGWKKIRILRHQNGYKIQFANLQETTHQEFVIAKTNEAHFQFFQMETVSLKEIQPQKNKWDLCFTVFTNVIDNPAINAATSYIFPDMVLHNTLSSVGVYQIKVAAGQGETAYNQFKKENIDETKFIKNDQRTIGSSWRTTTGANGAEVFSDRFYVLKDPDGFYFKIRFLKMKNTEGYRGFPEFEYKPL